MSKTKDELLNMLNELIEKYGFVADNEMLNRAIEVYSVSSFNNEELISKCKEVAIKVSKQNKKDADLILELIGRYRNLIVTEVAKEYLEDTESVDERNNEEGIEKEFTIKTIRGDIPVRVITIDLDNPSNGIRGDMVGDIIKSFINADSK